MEREHLGDLDENKKVVLKTDIMEIRCEMLHVDFICWKQNLMEEFFERIDEASGNFLNNWETTSFSTELGLFLFI